MLFSLLLQQTPANPVALFAPYVLIAVVFYFLLFMPMQKQKKKTQELLAGLKAGDSVVTNGGVIGTITAVDGEKIVLRIKPDNVKLEFARSAVNSTVPLEGSK